LIVALRERRREGKRERVRRSRGLSLWLSLFCNVDTPEICAEIESP